ncbi:hypothetical protein [Gottfriedia solisilvae]|uniref:hypothetical protein n=1 Tax=Gottfriedia solisilvae TaxID=1516104 RepID=UPI0013029195|nr:hypothetical protein [Gottfriedia solisilvae]
MKKVFVISTSGCSLSVGRELSLLGFTCGVSPFPLLPQESRTFRFNYSLYHRCALKGLFLKQVLLEKNDFFRSNQHSYLIKE